MDYFQKLIFAIIIIFFNSSNIFAQQASGCTTWVYNFRSSDCNSACNAECCSNVVWQGPRPGDSHKTNCYCVNNWCNNGGIDVKKPKSAPQRP